jgi:hypothetical protein
MLAAIIVVIVDLPEERLYLSIYEVAKFIFKKIINTILL